MIAYLNDNQTKYKKQLSYKFSTNVEFFKNKKYDYSIAEIDSIIEHKLLYVQNRLGIDIDSYGVNNFLNKYKIIVNLTDFLQYNNIDIINYRFKHEKQKEILKMVDEKFIGFMAIDKNFITFRNTVDDQPRYNNLKLVLDEVDNSKKLYMIEGKLDLAQPEYNVYVTEGIFDIMGVYNNIQNCKQDTNDIYVAANGKSYLLVFNTLLSMGVTNCNINIYSDQDVGIQFYRNMANYCPLLKLNGATVYYNELGKDVGVKKEQIKLSRGINI